MNLTRTGIRALLAASLLLLALPAAAQDATTDADDGPEQPATTQQMPDDGRYRIQSVKYDVKGLTLTSAINRRITVDTNRVFASRADLDAYVADVARTIGRWNEVESVSPTYDALTPQEDGTIPVALTYHMKDSFHLLFVPWPSYNSNSGLTFKLKLKDSNFLGLMEPFDLDLNYQAKHKDATNDQSELEHHVGFNFSFSYPFKTGKLNNRFNNSMWFDWLIDGSTLPEFGFNTGLSSSIPVGKRWLNVGFTQSITAENDYIPYDDRLYLTESGYINYPIYLGAVGGKYGVTYTPSVSFAYYWDPTDGVLANEKHNHLESPSMTISHSIGAGRVTNAESNQNQFRDGFSFSASQGFTWNFSSHVVLDRKDYDNVHNASSLSAYAQMELRLYKRWKNAGLTSRLYLYNGWQPLLTDLNSQSARGNATVSITERLRGTRDSMGSKTTGNQRYTDKALIFNFDVPIHIVTTDWMGWGQKLFGPYDERGGFMKALTWLPYHLLRYLDFELQLSPFVDVALTHNTATGRTFYWRDGFYNAGIEVLVYPKKWKGYVLRASFGVDVARIGFVSDKLRLNESKWRKPMSRWELSIGFGTAY